MKENTISFWNKTASKSEYPMLEKNIEVDTLIVGGGITGITCAYCLAQKGKTPVVIEAGGLCDGTTGNTTGKVTIQHDIIYSNIMQKYGKEFAKAYAESQTKALDFIRRQVENHSIDCQLTNYTSYIYASAEQDIDSLKNEYETALSLGIDAELNMKSNFPEGNFGLLGFRNQAAFHSVRYVDAIAKLAVESGAVIYCGTKAEKVENDDIKTVICDNGVVIKAKHLVMATQYPIYDGPNIYYTRLYAKREYGVAVSPKRDWPEGNYISSSGPSRSIRTHVEDGKKILIVVGDGHATARGDGSTEVHYDNLIRFADQVAGVSEVIARWSAQDYNTPDQIPYIGRISDHSNIYVATGFKKWGLTNGTLAGNMIADLITDGNCDYEDLYSRERGDLLSSAGTVIKEVLTSVGELIKSKFENVESIHDLKQGEGREVRFDGKRAGIYRDYDDNITIVNISCEHMTTGLNFNSAEKTWDCPAHGGRFSTEGKILEGPPKDPLKVLYKGKFSDIHKKYE